MVTRADAVYLRRDAPDGFCSGVDVLKAMLEHGADPDFSFDTSITPLAFCLGDREIDSGTRDALLELLVHHGADVQRTRVVQNKSLSLLDVSASIGYSFTVKHDPIWNSDMGEYVLDEAFFAAAVVETSGSTYDILEKVLRSCLA